MKLPNSENAVAPKPKITDYLLSFTHRDGRSKAQFFTRFGFSVENWEMLANALLRHAKENDVAEIEPSPFGTRYVIDGIIQSPDGRRPAIRSIWFIESGEQIPHLVSAYPLKGKNK